MLILCIVFIGRNLLNGQWYYFDVFTFQTDYWNLDSMDGFQYSLKTMLMMMWRQAPGIPSGNHGLFHRYNVEAVTLHGTKLKNAKQNLGFAEMGRSA